jgi:hypothetical protein
MLEWTELEEIHTKPGEVRFDKLLIKGAGLAKQSKFLNYLSIIMLPLAAHVVQWLKQRRKDLVILASPVHIPLWDMGAGPRMRPYKLRSCVTVRVARKRTLTPKSHEC